MHPDFSKPGPYACTWGKGPTVTPFLCNALTTLSEDRQPGRGREEAMSGFTVQCPLHMNFQVVNLQRWECVCQSLYVSCCKVLLHLSRYCIVWLKLFIFCVCFLCTYYLCEKYYRPITVHTYTNAQLCPTLCNPMDCAHQAPLSMGFSRQEWWSGLPCPPPGDPPDTGIEPASLVSFALEGRCFTTVATWVSLLWYSTIQLIASEEPRVTSFNLRKCSQNRTRSYVRDLLCPHDRMVMVVKMLK